MMNDLMQYIDINPIVEKAKELNCHFIAIIGGKGTGKTSKQEKDPEPDGKAANDE